MKSRLFLSGVLTMAISSSIASGCSMETGNAESEGDVTAESVGETQQALTLVDCKVGYMFNNGSWRAKKFEGTCNNYMDTAPIPFSFGDPGDIPLLFGGNVAVYGTSGDRLGLFSIDRDGSLTWGGSDTAVKFRSDAKAGDQPFVINLQLRSGPNCSLGSPGDPPGTIALDHPVVGIKRGGLWFIDANGNGVWDGTGPNKCDIQGSFGNSGDKPVPFNGHMVLARPVGSEMHFIIDSDNSRNYTEGDLTVTGFGLSTDIPFAGGPSQMHGVSRGRDVFLNMDGNLNWNGAPDVALTSFLPSTSWTFVGWEHDLVEEPPR